MTGRAKKERYVVSIIAVACVAVLLSTTIVAMNTWTTTTVTDSSDVGLASDYDDSGMVGISPPSTVRPDFWVDGIGYAKNKDGTTVSVAAMQGKSEVTIPDTVTHDGKTFDITTFKTDFYKQYGAGADTMIIGNNVKSIDACAFYGMSNLRVLRIGTGLEKIGVNAFCSCRNLQEVTINSDVREIAEVAFHDCYSLANVHIKSVGLIDKRAFANAANFDLTIDGDCGKIEINAFQEAYIKSFTVHGNIGVIVDKAFKGCDRLEDVFIGGIALLGNEAFRNCSSLKTLYIGYVSNNIESKAFAGCGSLSKMTFGIIEHLDGSAFDGITFKDYNGNVLGHTAHNIGNNGFVGANSVLTRC